MNMWILTVLAVIAAGILAGISVLAAVCLCAKRKFACVQSDCIIVLGALVRPDGRMCRSLVRRCETALEAWKKGMAPYIIVCGGQGKNEPVREAAAMQEWMIENGLPEDRVIAEDESADTRQNMVNARKIMGERGFGTAIICTSDYHLTRALWLARETDIPACGIAAPSPVTLRGLVLSRFRETVSWILYFFRII